MNVHKKLAFAALTLAVATGASAAAFNSPPGSPHRTASQNLPQFEKDLSHYGPSSSSSSSSSGGQVTLASAPMYPSIDNNPHLWDAQKPSVPIADTASAPYLPHVPTNPNQQYTFDTSSFANGSMSALGAGILVGGIAGLSGYIFCRTNQGMPGESAQGIALKIASGAALSAGIISTMKANHRLSEIKTTRENISSDRVAFYAQILKKLEPTLTSRVQDVENEMTQAARTNQRNIQQYSRDIEKINDNFAAIRYLPEHIERDQNALETLEQLTQEATNRRNNVLRRGVYIEENERKLGFEKFDSQVETAQKSLQKHEQDRDSNRQPRIRTLTDFLPDELIQQCPRTLGSNDLLFKSIGEGQLKFRRSEIAEKYALKFAEQRHEHEKATAQEAEQTAHNKVTECKQRIESNKSRLENLLANKFDDRAHCDELIANHQQQIEQISAAYEAQKATLEKQKQNAAQPTEPDITATKTNLTVSCNSSNHGWYSGLLFGGASTIAIAAVTGILAFMRG